MNTLSEIIKQAQKFIFCPVCNRSFNLEEIKLRGFLDDVYILQVKCEEIHGPVSMTIIIGKGADIRLKDSNGSHEVNHKLDQSSQVESILESDIYSIGTSLQTFDGDFESLWKK